MDIKTLLILWQFALPLLFLAILSSSCRVTNSTFHSTCQNYITFGKSSRIYSEFEKMSKFHRKNQLSWKYHLSRRIENSVGQKRGVQGLTEPNVHNRVEIILRLVLHYQRPVPDLAWISAPLNRMISKGDPWRCTEFVTAETKALEGLRQNPESPDIGFIKKKRQSKATFRRMQSANWMHTDARMTRWTEETAPILATITINSQKIWYNAQGMFAIVWDVLLLKSYLNGAKFTTWPDHSA